MYIYTHICLCIHRKRDRERGWGHATHQGVGACYWELGFVGRGAKPRWKHFKTLVLILNLCV